MANLVTLLRVIIAVMVLSLINITPFLNLLAICFIIFAMLLDILDGYLARKYKTSTLKGSIYDILADRVIENIFFIYFAAMGLINLWFPIIITTRGLIIDAIRSIYISSGSTAFGANTFHRKKWGKICTCSSLSRGLYNTFKMITFCCLAALIYPKSLIFNLISPKNLLTVTNVGLWLTVSLAIIRSIPVIVEGFFLNNLVLRTKK